MKNRALKKKYEIDMCSGKMLPLMIRFAAPLILSSLLQLLFNAADIIVVGQFGSDNSLAAVGSTSTLVSLVTNLFVGMAIGATVLTSVYAGAKDEEHIRMSVHSSMVFSLLSGALLTVAFLLFTKDILVLMLTPKDVLPLSEQYMNIYFAGLIPISVYNFGAALLRAKGDTKRPLYYLFFSGGVNVVLNLFFVIVMKMDVAGVALATVISECISAALVVRCLIKESGPYRLERKYFRLDPKTIKKILRIGVPAGVKNVLFNISNLVIQSAINSFGTVVMAGSAAAVSLENFAYVCMAGFEQTGMTFISQNLGAGKYTRVDRASRISLIGTTIIGVALGGLLVLTGGYLLLIFTDVPAEIHYGMIRLSIVAATMCLCGLMDAASSNIRGLGSSTVPTVVTLVGACGFRLVWIATLFQRTEFHTAGWLFASYPISWALTSLVLLICYAVLRRRFPRQDVDLDAQNTTTEAALPETQIS